jgi:hypothetical protein
VSCWRASVSIGSGIAMVEKATSNGLDSGSQPGGSFRHLGPARLHVRTEPAQPIGSDIVTSSPRQTHTAACSGVHRQPLPET